MSEVSRYYYVMWPEEREASSTTSSPSANSPRAAGTSVAVAVENGSDSHSVVKVHSNGPKAGSGAPLRVAYTHTQDPQTAQSSHSEDEEGSETPSPAGMLVVRPVVDGRDVLRATSSRGGKHHVIEKSTAVAMASGYCTRCMMKESEIQRLWKKIEGLEEQLCRALKTKRPRTLPSLDNVVTVSNSYGKHSHPSISPASSESSDEHRINNCSDRTTGEPLEGTAAKQVNSGSQKQDDKIELVPGTGLFISATRLQQILSTVKTGKQLARKLMSVFWDRITLARSTLSASSQHYEQLDPQVVSAIKTYCMLFDSSVRKSEIHSTMIDKCVQSRRPRRSSLKRMDYQDMKGSPTLLLPVSESGKPGQSFVCISAPKELVKSNEEEMSEEKMSD